MCICNSKILLTWQQCVETQTLTAFLPWHCQAVPCSLLRTSALEDVVVAIAPCFSLSLTSWELHKGNKKTLHPLSKALASEGVILLTSSQVNFLFGRQQECHSRRMSQGYPGSANSCWRQLQPGRQAGPAWKRGQGSRTGRDSLVLESGVAALDAVVGTSKATSWPW